MMQQFVQTLIIFSHFGILELFLVVQFFSTEMKLSQLAMNGQV